MWKKSWVVVLCVTSGVIGFAQQRRTVDAAAIPNPCNQYQCDNVSYWWDGSANTVKGVVWTGTTNQAVQGMEDIFTTLSTFQTPLNQLDGRFDILYYKACLPQCGKDANGVWQCPQEISPSGTSVVATQGVPQNSCTQVPNGQIGPTVNPPKNDNPNKTSPPGW